MADSVNRFIGASSITWNGITISTTNKGALGVSWELGSQYLEDRVGADKFPTYLETIEHYLEVTIFMRDCIMTSVPGEASADIVVTPIGSSVSPVTFKTAKLINSKGNIGKDALSSGSMSLRHLSADGQATPITVGA
jgi:hypothetical protein